MNHQIGRIAALTLGLFGLLFVNLNVITLLQADDLANHPANRRLITREYAIERGPIVVGEEAIARSVETDGQYRYLRVYQEPELYAHLTGYYSILLQRSNLEAALNEDLTGRPTEVLAQNLGELLRGGDEPGNSVELTIDPAGQEAARAALDGREGAVVALDPTDGSVLVSYANPTFDPNPLSSHDTREIAEAWDGLRESDDRPLVDRATGETYPPGSAFKLITTAAALEQGRQPGSSFDDVVEYDVPQTTANIRNFDGGVCADGNEVSLQVAFQRSCNTVFAELGVELGGDALLDQAERFGFNQRIPYELSVAASAFEQDLDDPAAAQSALGQRDVRATPMQMAVVASAIVNGGQTMRPHVVAGVRDPAGQRLRGPDIGRWSGPPGGGQAVSPRTAEQLRQLMVDAVRDGTGTGAAIDGVQVGGKTGTAQTGTPDAPGGPTVWFVGFAEDQVAIAVVLNDIGPDATGGGDAAPVARQVMAALLEQNG